MHSCTHWLRPPFPPQLGSHTSALLVSQDRRHLFVTPCLWWIQICLKWMRICNTGSGFFTVIYFTFEQALHLFSIINGKLNVAKIFWTVSARTRKRISALYLGMCIHSVKASPRPEFPAHRNGYPLLLFVQLNFTLKGNDSETLFSLFCFLLYQLVINFLFRISLRISWDFPIKNFKIDA